MTASPPIRVMIADDHVILRFGLALSLNRESDIEVVAEAGTGLRAIELFRSVRPDVTLMDLEMPGLGGLDAITAIRREFLDARVLVLTIHDGRVERALAAGARGFLLKDALFAQLPAAIRAVHEGREWRPPGGPAPAPRGSAALI
jgi:two-component system, NarL family, response regulator